MSAVTILSTILGFLGQIRTYLKGNFGVDIAEPPRPDDRKTYRWAKHIPDLARAVADMLDIAPALFAWVPFTGAGLRAKEEQVRVLHMIEALLAGLLEQVRRLLRDRKHDLFESTLLVMEGTRRILESPTTGAEDRKDLEAVSRPARAVQKNRGEKIATERRLRRGLRGKPPATPRKKKADTLLTRCVPLGIEAPPAEVPQEAPPDAVCAAESPSPADPVRPEPAEGRELLRQPCREGPDAPGEKDADSGQGVIVMALSGHHDVARTSAAALVAQPGREGPGAASACPGDG